MSTTTPQQALELHRRFQDIRSHYERLSPKRWTRDIWDIDPYAWDYPASGIQFSPIEEALWSDIRHEGAVLYPQFPVGRFFVDFGNPAAKVAIECDGAKWHTDKQHDRQRQNVLEDAGWAVYRLSGRQCLQLDREWLDEDGHWKLEANAGAQLIRRVCQEHRIRIGSNGGKPKSFEQLLKEQ